MDQVLHALAVVLEATTVVLLPDRIDLVSLILQFTGLFTVLATIALLLERHVPPPFRRYLRLEYVVLGATVLALLVFCAIWLRQTLD